MEKKIFLISQLENFFSCFTGFKRSLKLDYVSFEEKKRLTNNILICRVLKFQYNV